MAMISGSIRLRHVMMCGRLSGPLRQKGQRCTSDKELLNREPVVQAKLKERMQSAAKWGEWQLESRARDMSICCWVMAMLKCLLAHLEVLLKTRL